MNQDLFITRLVEYSICEYAIIAHKKSKSKSLTLQSFCERLRESIVSGDVSKWERGIIFWVIEVTNKIYCLPDDEFDLILTNFFIERRWNRYYEAIKMMECVRFSV